MPATILGLNGTTAATAANGFPVTIYRSDGSNPDQPFLGEYYAAANIPQFSAALAANAAVFAIRNGATRKMKLLLLEITASFAGTAAATTAQYSVRRFTTATPTAGTAGVIVTEDSAMSVSTAADFRYATAAAALTTTSVVASAPIYTAAVPRSVTGGVFKFEMRRDLVLNPNEGMLVQYDVAGVIGDAVSMNAYWGEY